MVADQTAELNIENGNQRKLQKKVQVVREDEEFKSHIIKWSHSKARIDSAANRKMEASKSGTHFEQLKFVPKLSSQEVQEELANIKNEDADDKPVYVKPRP